MRVQMAARGLIDRLSCKPENAGLVPAFSFASLARVAAKLSILVALFGTEGDMRPLLWFAHGMAARGHRITIHVNPHYREVADREGWPVLELGTADRFHEVMNDPRIWKPGEGTKLVLSTMIEALPMYQSSLDAARERFDLVVGTVLATGAMAWAEQKRIPRLLAYLQPMALRSAYDCPYYADALAWLPRMPPWVLRPLFLLSDTVGAPFYMGPINRHRRSLGLRPLSCFEDVLACADAIAALFPDWLVPRQPDWPPHLRQFGFPWPPSGSRTMPDDVIAFLSTGESPIVWTHGSANWDTARFVDIARETTRRLSARGIFVGAANVERSPDFMAVPHAPFEHLLPRSRALVQHAGIGTAMHAFAAGIPQVLVPRAHDQFDNAARVVRTGTGIAIRYEDFGAQAAATALTSLTGSDRVRAACATVRDRMRHQHALPALCDFAEGLARQSSTCVPSSTTRLVGIWKNSEAFTAFFDIDANSRSRHIAMPGDTVGISVSRETKKLVSIISNRKPRRPALLEQLGHVRILLEPVVREDLVEVAAQRLDRDAVLGLARTECRA